MGDPKKHTNKFKTPRHPWQKDRLDAENPLIQMYGLSNKRELWKVGSILASFKDNAKKLVTKKGKQGELEKKQLFDRLKSYNLLESDNLDEVLGLSIEQLLDRRLQTVVFKLGLARTLKQARQMITHRHINVNGKKVTAPSYLIKVSEENKIEFYSGSNFSNSEHPERIQEKPSKTEETVKKEKKSKTEKKKKEFSKVKKSMAEEKKAEENPIGKKEVEAKEEKTSKPKKVDSSSTEKEAKKE